MKKIIPVSILVLSTMSIATYGATTASPISQQNTIGVVRQIDLNQANVVNLNHAMKGIGIKRAEAIVVYRQQHGNFKSVSDLAYVPGLGSNFVKKHQAELEKIFIVK